MEDVVVVGIGLRFPGRARSAEGLWSVLTSGESQWSEFPAERLNIDGFYHPSRNRQGSIPFRGAQLLTGDVAAFDAPFFSVTKDEAEAIDPQQRMLLEVSYEALENAGLRKEALEGTMTSVFVGSFVKDYEQVCLRDPDNSPQYAATGNGIALMANRISYAYNFKGPSETIDTGCSGSLVSIHNAVQSLRAGESDLALAAGAGLILTPATMMPMTALNFLSPDGKCFTFDARANGYGRGEGIGVIVLKRLSDALRDNDTIRAVIRGSSKNQDGRTPGITLPSAEAQAANIRLAYSRAGLAFDQTAFVECHGTGTQAGDWRELSAISETIAKDRSRDSPVVVGSLKPNLGHLEGAAGVAGAIKGILSLEHGIIPPQANFETPNPAIDFEGWRVKVPISNLEWPLPGLRRASINCFGFGGSNVHLIMDDAATYLKIRSLQGNHNTNKATSAVRGNGDAVFSSGCSVSATVPHVFNFSGPDKQALKRVLTSQVAYLESVSKRSTTDPDFLRNHSYTLGCRRSIFEWRLSLVSDSVEDLLGQLKNLPESQLRRASSTNIRTCFVFAGQGTQWAQMGQSLYQNFKVFRDSIDRASNFMQLELRSSFNLVEEMFKEKSVSRISSPDISQPATTSWQIALVDLIAKFSAEPSHVIGHSSGEIAAAYASGSLSREDAWTIAYYRGFYAASVPILLRGMEGGMLATGLSHENAQSYAKMVPKVQVACVNSFRSTTLSGPMESLQVIAKKLGEEQIFNRFLRTGVAYHSHYMKLVSPLYERSIRNIEPRASTRGIRMFSSVTGKEISGDKLDGAYWAKNMVSVVQYSAAMESLLSLPSTDRPVSVIEISPRAGLLSPTSDTISNISLATPPEYQSAMSSSASNSSQSLSHLLQVLGNVWERGSRLDVLSILRSTDEFGMPKCLVDLPSYPWNHTTKYWFESHLSSEIRFRPHGREDLIGVMVPGALPQEPSWRNFLRIAENPWLQDHKVQKAVVFPAAGYVSMVLEAAKQMTERLDTIVGFELSDVQFEKALLIPSDAHGVEVLLSIKRMDTVKTSSSESFFSIYSRVADSAWQTHATGRLIFCQQLDDWRPALEQYDAEYKRQEALCKVSVAPRQLYELLDNIGMNYGQLFRNIKEIRSTPGACVSRIAVPDTRSKMPEKFEYPHLIHPATLDSMIHTLFAVDMTPRVPVSVQRIFVSADIAKDGYQDFNGVSTAQRVGFTRARADIAMSRGRDRKSHVIIEGLEVASITDREGSGGGFLPNTRNLCSELIWKKDVRFARATRFPDLVDLLAHKMPGLSILQLGGDRELMQSVLDVVAPSQKLTPRLLRYTLAKTSDADDVQSCVELAERHSIKHFLEIAVFARMEPSAAFHLVLMAENLDSGEDVVAQHLHAGGLLAKKATISALGDEAPLDATEVSSHRTLGYSTAYNESIALIILVGESRLAGVEPLWVEIQNTIITVGLSSTVTVLTMREFLDSEDVDAGAVVLSLLDVLGGITSSQDWTKQQFEDFHALQSKTKKLLWLTRGSFMIPTRPQGSSLVGLMRVLMAEDPKKTYAALDLGYDTDINHPHTAQSICDVLHATFFDPHPGIVDVEYAEHKGELFIPRLVPVSGLNDIIEPPPIGETLQRENFSSSISGRRNLRLTLTAGGRHHFEPIEIPELGREEVAITFVSAPLTSNDVAVAGGSTTRTSIGSDVCGRVVQVGSEVSNVSVGDEVAGLTSVGAIQSLLHLDRRLVRRVPSGFIPSLYVSAFHALSYVSRAREGQSVLIHPGAGPQGLAAVAMATQLGLKVLATTIGAEDDREEQSRLLQTAGVSSDHILDANSVGFVTLAQHLTASRGVDIVYNVAEKPGDTLAKCVRRNGYFVQPHPIAACGRTPDLATPLTFATFDLHSLIEEDPGFIGELFDGAIELMKSSSIMSALVTQGSDFGVNQTVEALQEIAKSPHMGFATIRHDPSRMCKVDVRSKVAIKDLSDSIDIDGTYLIVGGFHGLGKSIADLLIKNGARHIAFMSRSAGSSEESKMELSKLRALGTDVRAFCADICDMKILDQAVAQISSEMPPIKGVFQCAAVIQDAVFDNMTFEDWQAGTRPKMTGSQNLVNAMEKAEHDPFYVFLASSSGVIGNRGQANYAAGNAFVDALARSLRLQGKHAVSLDLGPVLGAGMLNEDEAVFDMLRASGFYSISHDDFLTLIKHAIMGEIVDGKPMPAQVTTGVGTGGLVLQNQPADPYWTRTALFSYLNLVDLPPPDLTSPTATSSLSASFNLRAKLTRAASREAAIDLIASGIQAMLAKSMNMLPEEISVERAPNAYGVDSLVAIGLRNWVQGNCEVDMSLFEVLSDRTVQGMAGLIAERGGYGVE